MAKEQAYPPVARSRSRTPAPRQTAAVSARAEEHAPKKRFNPAQFFREVNVERKKITWPSWRETWITTLMVFLMVVVMAVFFFVVDLVLSLGVTQILKLGG
jgi:preprotein translocase subunit SecE